MTKKILLLIILLCTSQFLHGCVNAIKNSVIPHNGLSMQQIYEQQIHGNNTDEVEKIRKDVYNNESYFLIKNQPLKMYVYPYFLHNQKISVLGYSTTFTMS